MRFQITLEIEARQPVSVGIIAYDPYRAFSDYFRRKVSFKGKRQHRTIHVPFPVSPDHLVLEVYNKETLDNTGFKVTGFDLSELPAAEVWASPERHRYMDFAIGFAQKAGHARPGFYHSPDHEFLLQYLARITDETGNELVTPARVHRQMPRVQLSQKHFRQYTVPVRVAILSHEGCHFFMNTRSEKNADLCGLQYYLDYGFPTIEAVYAATKVFRQHPGSIGKPHVDRTADIISFINEHKAKQPDFHLNQPIR